jgi:hypothetical protein
MKLKHGGSWTVAAALLLAGSLTLVATAATAPRKPKNTALPTISGTAAVGQTLTASPGSWSGTTPFTFYYQWGRSNGKGGFDPIVGAARSTYTLTSSDAGHTLFVQVKATNADGEDWADSKPTQTVSNPPGTTMAIAAVSLPDRLMISGFTTLASTTASEGRAAIQARFQVMDSEGHPVQGALVYAIGLPYGWAVNAPEQPTGSDGWASITVKPTAQMPRAAQHLVMFVRARKPGDSLLAGVSTRRLVQASFPAL